MGPTISKFMVLWIYRRRAAAFYIEGGLTRGSECCHWGPTVAILLHRAFISSSSMTMPAVWVSLSLLSGAFFLQEQKAKHSVVNHRGAHIYAAGRRRLK